MGGGGIFDDESAAEQLEKEDKGELKYQESKEFHSECFLCSAYDNPKARHVTIEIYGLDTQDMLHLAYEYAAFDGLFRFNAELMNPNRKEGRFHWIFERLAIETVNKERKLKLLPEPSEEVPQLPVYETTRKIPTGRMDLKERQRLREQMEMLDVRRSENIAKKRQATKQRVLQHIFRLKEEHKWRREEQERNMAQARAEKYKLDDELARRRREEEARLDSLRTMRGKAVETKEVRTEEQDEEEYRQLRARWRIRDAEKAKIIAGTHARKAKERQELAETEKKEKRHLLEVQSKREALWGFREERVRKKQEAKIKQVLEWKKERLRREKLQRERNAEYLQLLHAERQPLFKAQLERTEERREAREAEAEALASYQEKRAIPKKVKTKGKNAVKKTEKEGSKSKGKAKTKSKGDKDHEAEGAAEASGKGDTEKVLDAVEARMRQQMEDQRQRELLDGKRERRIKEMEEARVEKENEHNKEVREAHRQAETAQAHTAAERRLIMQQRGLELQAALERKKAERARLEKVREHNIARREQLRLAALCA